MLFVKRNIKACLLMMLFGSTFLFGQDELDAMDVEMIKRNIVKRQYLISAIFNKKYLGDSQFFLDYMQSDEVLSFLGFGYVPSTIGCTITPKPDASYPNKKLRLYEVSFIVPRNDTIIAWSNIRGLFNMSNRILIGLDDSKNITCISGCGINNFIAKDFKLKKRKPKSYIPFLKFKYHVYGIDSISFLKKENGKLFFLARNVEGSKIFDHQISLRPNDPERSCTIRYNYFFDRTSTSSQQPIKLNTNSYAYKRAYLLDALMKNIYL